MNMLELPPAQHVVLQTLVAHTLFYLPCDPRQLIVSIYLADPLTPCLSNSLSCSTAVISVCQTVSCLCPTTIPVTPVSVNSSIYYNAYSIRTLFPVTCIPSSQLLSFCLSICRPCLFSCLSYPESFVSV